MTADCYCFYLVGILVGICNRVYLLFSTSLVNHQRRLISEAFSNNFARVLFEVESSSYRYECVTEKGCNCKRYVLHSICICRDVLLQCHLFTVNAKLTVYNVGRSPLSDRYVQRLNGMLVNWLRLQIYLKILLLPNTVTQRPVFV